MTDSKLRDPVHFVGHWINTEASSGHFEAWHRHTVLCYEHGVALTQVSQNQDSSSYTIFLS